MQRLLTFVFCAAVFASAALADQGDQGDQGRPNVLLICVDDLRPELGCYGASHMVTPNIDRLAAQGRRFERHYVHVPSCGPSRFAMLTSRRPGPAASFTMAAFKLIDRDKTPSEQATNLPHLFRLHGYTTVSLGKVSHNPDGRTTAGEVEVPFGWDETWGPTGDWGTAWNAFFGYAGGKTRGPAVPPAISPVGNMPNHENANVDDTGYPDGLTAEEAVRRLRRFKDASKPFFLAVGFFKPHLPLNAPRKYWDLYEHDEIKLSPNPQAPVNVDPGVSLHNFGELTPRYTGLATPGVVTDDEARTLRHAYFAAVSYTDAQVGKLLAALEETGLSRNTIVVLWGDHGWHLGDHGIWAKATLHERSLHSPLIIRTPRMNEPGASARGVVESVDVYPTLADLCGLPAPEGLAGVSLRPLLQDPQHAGKTGAESAWNLHGRRGHTLRTDRYRLIEYRDDQKIAQTELYDHQADPLESTNIAADHPQIVERLRQQMREHEPTLR